MSAVFAQEMHQSKCGPNAELISPLRRRSTPAGPKVCRGGEDPAPAQMFNMSPGQTQHFWLPAASRLPPSEEGGFEEAERKEITELNTSLEQAFSFRCHNISPFPYIRISTNTQSSRKQYTRGNGDLWREASWFWRSVIPWHQLRRCPHQL